MVNQNGTELTSAPPAFFCSRPWTSFRIDDHKGVVFQKWRWQLL
jgi:hypothetical protein